MSKHEEYEFVSDYDGYRDGIAAPFTYAARIFRKYHPVTVIHDYGSFLWVQRNRFEPPFTIRKDDVHMVVRKKPKEPHELYVSINKHTGSLDYMAYDKKDFLELDVDPSSIIKVREVPKE